MSDQLSHNQPLPQPGDRVRITGVMANDPAPISVGSLGTVTGINESAGQIYVDWDLKPGESRPRSLILLVDDPFVITDRQ